MPDPARSAADDGADLTEHVLADRLAAVVIRREPGYSLPRRTVLARRFEASAGQMDAAIEELVRRQLVRRLPTGELRRAGPVDYVLSLDGLPGLSSFVDPMELLTGPGRLLAPAPCGSRSSRRRGRSRAVCA